jgi:hypothetical protein
MSIVTVTTQTELDTALADAAITEIHIKSAHGVWLQLSTTAEDKYVRASGSATVRAFGSATVRAFGSATVEASGSATVEASDSATVEASGSATVEASDSATVRASDSATVEASDSATVRASGSATVRAFGSATVEASGSATVHGHHASRITAGSHVAVHLHSGTCHADGGVLIDHTAVDQSDPGMWCSYHGVTVYHGHDTDRDIAILYKAVRDDWRSAHGTSYQPGTTATCEDFVADGCCGGGLHVAPTPNQAKTYDHEATRFVEVRVALAEMNVIGADKVKAASIECVREVDVHGRPIANPVGTEDGVTS